MYTYVHAIALSVCKCVLANACVCVYEGVEMKLPMPAAAR